MSGAWLASYAALWLVVLALVVAVLTLARQVGLVLTRIPPAGARMENAGPAIGAKAPELIGRDFTGSDLRLASQRGKRTLLVFMASNCDACESLVPSLRSVAMSERATTETLVIFSRPSEQAARDFVKEHGLRGVVAGFAPDLVIRYGVTSTPYGLMVDQQGFVRAKGVVNHLEHIESLINATDSGLPSVEAAARARAGGQIQLGVKE
jgi:methylamine dehydrogenase accessory protein MauD